MFRTIRTGGRPAGPSPAWGQCVAKAGKIRQGEVVVSGDHYFTADPAVAHERHQVAFTALDQEFRLASASGVFSSSLLDPGTPALLSRAPLPDPRTTSARPGLSSAYVASTT